MTPTAVFTCSICGEPSVSICVYCTKDACPNHICDRCGRCSDCCECDVRLEEPHEHVTEAALIVEETRTTELEQPPLEPSATPPKPEVPLSAEQWNQPEAPPPNVASESLEK